MLHSVRFPLQLDKAKAEQLATAYETHCVCVALDGKAWTDSDDDFMSPKARRPAPRKKRTPPKASRPTSAAPPLAKVLQPPLAAAARSALAPITNEPLRQASASPQAGSKDKQSVAALMDRLEAADHREPAAAAAAPQPPTTTTPRRATRSSAILSTAASPLPTGQQRVVAQSRGRSQRAADPQSAAAAGSAPLPSSLEPSPALAAAAGAAEEQAGPSASGAARQPTLQSVLKSIASRLAGGTLPAAADAAGTNQADPALAQPAANSALPVRRTSPRRKKQKQDQPAAPASINDMASKPAHALQACPNTAGAALLSSLPALRELRGAAADVFTAAANPDPLTVWTGDLRAARLRPATNAAATPSPRKRARPDGCAPAESGRPCPSTSQPAPECDAFSPGTLFRIADEAAGVVEAGILPPPGPSRPAAAGATDSEATVSAAGDSENVSSSPGQRCGDGNVIADLLYSFLVSSLS